MIDVRSITAGYDGAAVLHGVSIRADSKSIVALVGRNASGKSTLLKAMMGLVPITKGRLNFLGADFTRRSARERVEAGLGYMPQGGVLFPDLTIQENVEAYLGRRYSYDAMFEYLYHWPLVESLKTGQLLGTMLRLLGRNGAKARSLSGGEKQIVSIARTLLRPSRFVLLDEPSIGLSPRLLLELGDLLKEIASTGIGMLIVDQNVNWILEVANYAYVLQQGTVCAEGDSKDFLANREQLYQAFGLNVSGART
jgi:branched-chain amino acid transport system ATP-binding protein